MSGIVSSGEQTALFSKTILLQNFEWSIK